MRNYQYCNQCEEHHYSDKPCAPEYKVYHEDYLGDDPKIFHAFSHEDAALKYAEYYNSDGDHQLMNETTEVQVVKDGLVKFFNISAEPDIYYSADEVKK